MHDSVIYSHELSGLDHYNIIIQVQVSIVTYFFRSLSKKLVFVPVNISLALLLFSGQIEIEPVLRSNCFCLLTNNYNDTPYYTSYWSKPGDRSLSDIPHCSDKHFTYSLPNLCCPHRILADYTMEIFAVQKFCQAQLPLYCRNFWWE